MAVKIITLDLDGTLMSPDHLTVSQENKDALRAAHEKGVKIAVATGRTLAIMGDVRTLLIRCACTSCMLVICLTL